MSYFGDLEIANIVSTKVQLRQQLSTFNLTISKLHNAFTNCYFVTGGCIGSLLRLEEPNDYDIYFFSKLKADAVVDLYTKDVSYKNEVAEWEEKYRDAPVGRKMITENAITLKNKIQLITKNYGEPQEIRKSFDFVHCMPYYDTRVDKLYISREQYDLCMKKQLKPNIDVNIISKKRIEKYESRGYTWL